MPPLTRLIEVSIKPIEPAETEVLEKWIAHGGAGSREFNLTWRRPNPTRWSPTKTATSGPSGRHSAVTPPAVKHVEPRSQSDRRIHPGKTGSQRAVACRRGRPAAPVAAGDVRSHRPAPEPAEVEAFLADRPARRV